MNEKTGTGVSSEKEKVKESQSRSVTPSLDTPSGAGLGVSHKQNIIHMFLNNKFSRTTSFILKIIIFLIHGLGKCE